MSNVWVVGSAWFASSAILSTFANTAFLKAIPSPFFLTLVRFLGSAVIGFLFNLVDRTKDRLDVESAFLWREFLIASVCLLSANYANSVALQYSGITLTYVVKSCIPVATVLISALQGTWFNHVVYLTIVPTVIGVSLAAWSDVEFSLIGLFAAIFSMLLQTLLNFESKRVIQKTKVSGIKAQFIMVSTCSCLLALPSAYMIFLDRGLLGSVEDEQLDNASWLSFLAAFAYHLEYSLNFVFTGLVDPLAFSVADIARRLSIIGAGSILFDKELTTLNKIGVCICFAGVLWFNLVDKTPTGSVSEAQQSKQLSKGKQAAPRHTKRT